MGPSGRLLLELLQEAEFDAGYTVANAVCCRPPDNKTPTTTQWRSCSSHYLHKTILKQRPRLIVCFGGVAAKAVLNDTSATIKSARRKILYIERFVRTKKKPTKKTIQIPVVVTYHPAAVLRDPTKRSVVVEDLRQFVRILAGEEVEEDPSDRIYIHQGHDEDLPWNHRAGHTLALDLETNRLSPFESGSKIIAASVSQAPLHAHAFFVGDNLATTRFAKALDDRQSLKVGHNLKFDLLWLKKNGFRVNGSIFDTMIAHHLIDENYPDRRLGHLADLFLGMKYDEEIKSERTQEGYMQRLFTEDPDRAFTYACMDADAPYRLAALFRTELRRQRLLKPFHLSMRLLRTLVDIELAGCQIDGDALDVEASGLELEKKRISRFLKKRHPHLNPRSSQQVAHLVFEHFGISPTKRTATRRPSADEESLNSAMKRANDAYQEKSIRGILALRRVNKLLGTYVTPMRDEHLMPDGRVHPTYKLATAVTGRLSCENPNFQNMPPRFRKMFVSRFKDGYIVQADFSQMELRVLAHCSGEPRLLEAFEKDRDVHLETAMAVLGKRAKSITKQERALAKMVNFAILYGAGPGRIAGETGMSFADAEEFIHKYFKAMPDVRAWIHQIHREVLKNQEVTTLFGRKRRLPFDDPESENGKRAMRQGVNTVIQSPASDINGLCMADIHSIMRRGMDSLIIGTVHDSIIYDCTKRELDDVLMMTQEVCERPNTKWYGFELDVPLKVDLSFGPNWYDQKGLPN